MNLVGSYLQLLRVCVFWLGVFWLKDSRSINKSFEFVEIDQSQLLKQSVRIHLDHPCRNGNRICGIGKVDPRL